MTEQVNKAIEISAVMAPAGDSQQPEEKANQWTPNEAIDPPENLDELASLTQISPIRRSCIQAITLNTVGLGFTLAPRKGMEEETGEDDIEQATQLLNECAKRDIRSGSPTFSKLIQRVKWDEYEVGNGYLEVSRNRVTGQIDGLFHAPGKRVRRLVDRSGWVVGSRDASVGDKIRFDNFGDKVQYGSDGKPLDSLQQGKGKRWARNELIAFQLYTSESRDYGLPPDAQLAWDYLGDKSAAETNINYFGSDGVPPTVFFIKAEPTDDGKVKKVDIKSSVPKAIADTMRGSQGKRVAIVPMPSDMKIQREDMQKLSDDDVGFVAYRSDNRRRTLGAFRLAPIFVADIEDAGKDTAGEEKAITKEQVFDPEQHDWEDRLSDTLLRDLGFPHLRFDFTEMDTTDKDVDRQSANDAAALGLITNGEYREKMGWAPLPEAIEGQEPKTGEVAFGWNAELVKKPNAPAGSLQAGVDAAAQLVSSAQIASGFAAGDRPAPVE